jgi:hypothetical protein
MRVNRALFVFQKRTRAPLVYVSWPAFVALDLAPGPFLDVARLDASKPDGDVTTMVTTGAARNRDEKFAYYVVGYLVEYVQRFEWVGRTVVDDAL